MPSTFAKVRNKPSTRRSRWFASPTSASDLRYLGWGSRFYGLRPTLCKPSAGWSYEFVQSGSPILVLPGKKEDTAAGDFFIFGTRCAHGWTNRPERRSEALVCIWRSPPRSARCRPLEEGLLKFTIHSVAGRAIERIHAMFRQEVSFPDASTPLALERLRLELEVLLARLSDPAGSLFSDSKRLDLATRWMKENLAARRPVTFLCDYLQMSSGAVEHLFLEKLGETPSSYFQRSKMVHAAEMLKAGKSVKEVAYSLGYSHANDFSRAFKTFTTTRTKPKR